MTIPAIVLDTEATNVDNPEVIELAYLEFDIADKTMQSPIHSQRFKPATPPAWGALAVHHILMEELEGARPSEVAASHVPPAQYWIGHNVDFDWKALGQPPARRICTLAMCRSIWPKVDSHSLVAMMYYLCGANRATRDLVRGAHGAATDIHLTRIILHQILQFEEISDLETLWQFSEEARIPKTFSFGKFKGQPISAADRGYANWYARQPDPDPYLLQAFKRARLL